MGMLMTYSHHVLLGAYPLSTEQTWDQSAVHHLITPTSEGLFSMWCGQETSVH